MTIEFCQILSDFSEDLYPSTYFKNLSLSFIFNFSKTEKYVNKCSLSCYLTFPPPQLKCEPLTPVRVQHLIYRTSLWRQCVNVCAQEETKEVWVWKYFSLRPWFLTCSPEDSYSPFDQCSFLLLITHHTCSVNSASTMCISKLLCLWAHTLNLDLKHRLSFFPDTNQPQLKITPSETR